MAGSTLSARWIAFSVLAIALTAGCAQPGTGVSASLTAPSPSAAAVGPGASYNATGTWHFVVTIPGSPDEIFDAYVTQDSDGNLSFLNPDNQLVVLERVGTGVLITYRRSQAGPASGTECNVLAQGTALIDTRTDTFTGRLMLRELGCSHQVFQGIVVTATRLN